MRSNFATARLKTDCALDATFGSGGKLYGSFDAAMAGNDGTAVAFGGSGVVLAGFASANDVDGQFGIAQIKLDLIFSNAFEH